MSEQCLVNVAEAARRLGLAKSSLYRMAANGLVPSYAAGPKLSGRRFDVEEVRQALRQATKKGNDDDGRSSPKA